MSNYRHVASIYTGQYLPKLPIDCNKYHMMPPLSKEQKLTPATLPQIKSLPMHGTVGTMLAHLDYLVCCV